MTTDFIPLQRSCWIKNLQSSDTQIYLRVAKEKPGFAAGRQFTLIATESSLARSSAASTTSTTFYSSITLACLGPTRVIHSGHPTLADRSHSALDSTRNWLTR